MCSRPPRLSSLHESEPSKPEVAGGGPGWGLFPIGGAGQMGESAMVTLVTELQRRSWNQNEWSSV